LQEPVNSEVRRFYVDFILTTRITRVQMPDWPIAHRFISLLLF